MSNTTMSMREILKSYFQVGKRPTAEQFEQLVDEMISRTDDEIFVDEVTKNVGFGIQNPSNKLDVSGSVAIGSNYAGKKEVPYVNSLIVEGRVGIGIKNPKEKLHVEGTIVANDLYSENTIEVRDGLIIGTSYVDKNEDPNNGLLVEGNVGIGTTHPTEKLEVKGAIKAEKISISGGFSVGNTNQAEPGTIRWTGEDLEVLNISGAWQSLTKGSGESMWERTEKGETRLQTEKIAIGKKEPSNTLDVSGNLSVGFPSSSTQEAPASGLLVNGNVGIGKYPDKDAKLDVKGAIHAKAIYVNGEEITHGESSKVNPISELILQNDEGSSKPITDGTLIPIKELSGSFILKLSVPEAKKLNDQNLEVVYYEPYLFPVGVTIDHNMQLQETQSGCSSPLQLNYEKQLLDDFTVEITLSKKVLDYINGKLDKEAAIEIGINGSQIMPELANTTISWKITPDLEFIESWGGVGDNKNESLLSSWGITVSKKSVFVVDQIYHNIKEYDLNGQFLRQYGNLFMLRDVWHHFRALAIDSNKRIIALNDNVILLHDANGRLIDKYERRGLYFEGLSIDQFDNIYVSSRRTVYQFDSELKSQKTFDIYKFFPLEEERHLNSIHLNNVAVDAEGNVYACERELFFKFDSEGNPVKYWKIANSYQLRFITSQDPSNTHLYTVSNRKINRYDSEGLLDSDWSGLLQDLYVRDVRVDNDNNVIVLEENGGIIKLNPSDGTREQVWTNENQLLQSPQFSIPCGDDQYLLFDSGGHHSERGLKKLNPSSSEIEKISKYADEPGNFIHPRGIAVSQKGHIYVADMSNHRIQKFKPGKNPKFETIGSQGSGPGQFESPVSVAVSTDHKLYVVDRGNSRVQIFSENGEFQGYLRNSKLDEMVHHDRSSIAARTNVYFGDYRNRRILKFSPAGEFIKEWKIRGIHEDVDELLHLSSRGGIGLALDHQENVYIYSQALGYLEIYDNEGTLITSLGSLFKKDQSINHLTSGGIAVDDQQMLYVLDAFQVQKFRNNLKK
ncbi:NHL repeat-containing protein [Ekhidna sp.]